MRLKINKIFIALSLLTVLLLPLVKIEAQTTTPKLKQYLDVARQESGYDAEVGNQSLPTAIINIINYALGFIGIIFLILIVYSGFQWMTAGGSEEKISQARKRMVNAAIGLAITLGAFIISYTIFKFLFNETLQTPPGGIEPPPGFGETIPCLNDGQCADRTPRIWCSSGNCVECRDNWDCYSPRTFCHPTWHTCMLPEGTSCAEIGDPDLCLGNDCKWIVTGHGDGGTWATGQCVDSSHACPQCGEHVPVCVEIDNPPAGPPNNVMSCVECVIDVARGDCTSLQTCDWVNSCIP